MARLFGKREGAWIDIPEDQVQEAYMSGMYAFPADTEINVQLKDGRYGTMPAEHAEDAFRSGASYDQADIRQERVDSASYDERNLEAGALAVARGLSFGLSDVIAENIAGYSEEELHKLEKYNANISMVGEIGGVVLPALASGGTSLVARGLAKGTIAGLSAKAGIAAEKAILGRFGAKESVAGFELAQSTANKMIQGGAALTGAATVEGALFGAVDGFSEQMLGRADRTAEQMLSHIGGITLLSGGLGGILGLASPLAGKLMGTISGSKLGDAVSKKTKDWQASILSAMHRGDKETYRRLLEPEHAHDVIFGSQKIADDVADDMGTFINDAVDGLELATRSVSGSEKQRLMREVVSAEDPLGAIDESINRLYQARQTIRAEMETSFIGGPEVAALKKADAGIQKQIDLIVSMVKDGAAEGDFVVREFGEKLRAFFKEDMGPKRDASGRFRTLNVDEGRTLKDLNTPEFFESVLPEVFIAMDSLKRAIGGVAYKRAGGPIDVATSPLMGAYHGIKNALENESLFGVVAATRQRETNQAFTDLIPSYEKFLRKFTDDGEKAGLGTASREATEGEATVMATAESKELDDQIEILSDFRERLKADRTHDLEDIRHKSDDGFDEFRMRAESDVGTSIVTKKVDEVAANIRANAGDEAADAYEDAAKAQAQRNTDTRTRKDPNASRNQAKIKEFEDEIRENKTILGHLDILKNRLLKEGKEGTKEYERAGVDIGILENYALKLESRLKEAAASPGIPLNASKNQAKIKEVEDELQRARDDFKEIKNMLKGMEGQGQKGTRGYQELEEEIVDFEKYLLNKESETASLIKDFKNPPGIPLIEKAFQRLEATIEAAKVHASTLDDGIESIVDYRKKLEVVNKKAGSLRGNLGRMKQGATPNAAKMEAIRKELNEVVEESIEVTNARPGLGLDEAANRDTFRAAADEHKEVGRALKNQTEDARKAVERAKTAVAKDPEGLVDLEKKLGDLITRSTKHDRTPPLKKNYKKTKDLGDKKRRGRVVKWSGVKSFLKKAHKMDQSDEARVFQEFINNYGTFLSTIEREYGKGTLLTAGKTQTVKGLQNSYESLNKKWDDLGEIQLAYKEVHSAHSPLTTMLAAVPMGGLAATGPLGYLAGAATTALISPAAGFKRRAMIHGIKSQVAATLNKRATHVVNRISGNMKPGAPQKARALPVLLALLGVKATGDPRKDKRAAMDGVAQLSDPNFLFARLESSTKELDEAPKIKEEIFKGMSAHANILSEASESFGAASYDPITGENETYRSDADVSKFMSIAEVGIGGTNVVADKMIAKTLTKAEGKAYREFYPIESQEFIETVLAKLAKKDEKISWDDKYQLTQLAGIPMTNTLNPVFIVSMQSIHKASVKSSGGRKNDNALKKTASAGKTLVEQAMFG